MKFTTPRYTLLFLYSEIYIIHIIYCEWSRFINFPLCMFCMRYKHVFFQQLLLTLMLNMWKLDSTRPKYVIKTKQNKQKARTLNLHFWAWVSVCIQRVCMCIPTVCSMYACIEHMQQEFRDSRAQHYLNTQRTLKKIWSLKKWGKNKGSWIHMILHIDVYSLWTSFVWITYHLH